MRSLWPTIVERAVLMAESEWAIYQFETDLGSETTALVGESIERARTEGDDSRPVTDIFSGASKQ